MLSRALLHTGRVRLADAVSTRRLQRARATKAALLSLPPRLPFLAPPSTLIPSRYSSSSSASSHGSVDDSSAGEPQDRQLDSRAWATAGARSAEADDPSAGAREQGGAASEAESGAKVDEDEGDVHAVISTFDLFSIGVGPSSSHTLGPSRAASIFVASLRSLHLLHRVKTLKIALYGSLCATGKGHLTPQALVMGLEGGDAETVDTDSIPKRYDELESEKWLQLGGDHRIDFDLDKDLLWMWGQVLPVHSNGMRFSVFDENGDLLATNDYVSGVPASSNSPPFASSRDLLPDPFFLRPSRIPSSAVIIPFEKFSVGGGFVVNSDTEVGQENLFYKQINKDEADPARREAHHEHLISGSGAEDIGIARIQGGQANVGDGGGSAPGSRLVSSKSESESESARDNTSLSPSSSSQRSQQGKVNGSSTTTSQASSPSTSDPGVPFPFHDGASLLALTRRHNMTIAQIVYNNERRWRTDEEIKEQIFRIWSVMDNCIRTGVQTTETHLPGRLRLKRRAPSLYANLLRGFYPSFIGPGATTSEGQVARALGVDGKAAASASMLAPGRAPSAAAGGKAMGPPRVRGQFDHALLPIPPRKTVFPLVNFLSTYAIAVNEVNASGGRVVTSPTNGAAGVIPAVLKYVTEFISDDVERDVQTFLLTAAAIGMLFKRGATISAAEGGCMAEVGVACAMAAGGFAACMGASPEVIEQAAEIGIEHNLGLTCDPVDGMVQAPCIERNALGAVKAVTAAQLALASGDGQHAVSLDEAISAMRVTARDMHVRYKETSLSGLATSVKIPVAVPDC